MHELENKPYFKIGEVCEITGTQPYVLRFWESEFPTLAPEKNRSGQRVYRKRDIDLIHRIKTLLYEKEYTIAGARKVLESDGGDESRGAGHDDDASDASAPTGSRTLRPAAQRTSSTKHASQDDTSPALPFKVSASLSESALEVEVKNLRAKLARAESELKLILDDMDRQDTNHS